MYVAELGLELEKVLILSLGILKAFQSGSLLGYLLRCCPLLKTPGSLKLFWA